jgi:four helix bundle protein
VEKVSFLLRDKGKKGQRDQGKASSLRYASLNQNLQKSKRSTWGRHSSNSSCGSAVELSVAIYQLTSSFPKTEQFGLTSQLRRASVSVASNIAEGYGRSTRGEYVLFLGHARGSVSELQTQLVIADALSFGTTESRMTAVKLAEDVSRLLNALIDKLSTK